MADQTAREQRGQTVRETWVTWAKRQRAPKHSWLVPWCNLDDGQREVDMLIGDALTAAERERVRVAATEASFTLFRPGNGPAHGQALAVLPLGELLAILGEEPGLG
jgi:hypothetical protein